MVGVRLDRVALAVAMIIALSGGLSEVVAQGLTGQISSTVTDAGQGVLPGATVTIRNAETSNTRETVTGADGTFVFPDLLAGTYDIKVTVEGFKSYEQKGVSLGATERLTLRTIVLEVGQLSESVTVMAEAVTVQTQTAARSGLINREQMDDIAIKGRDFAGLLQTLPGVIDTRNREAPGWGSMGGLSINGRSSFNFSYDGVTNKDTGSNSGNYAAPALDSIAEVRVQTSNFQAEYGRSSGATIAVVTRSGTKNFRGSAAYYKRDEAFNGNEYSRRQQNLPKPLYDFDNFAWTIGGPVLLPGGFNRQRNKLFFFWSQDILTRVDPGGLNQRRVPTALERNGDFSQTFDANGRLVNVRDPQLTGSCSSQSGGAACFPGNVMPSSRFDPVARALVNLLPLPNATDPTGRNQYNYVFQTAQDWPRDDQVLRLDWNIAPNTNYYQRWQYGYEKRSGGVSFLGSSGGWPQYPTKYEIDTVSFVNTLLHTFNPTTVMEVTAGVNWAHQYTSPLDQAAQDANDRSKVLPGLPQFFPVANPLNVLPQVSFGGGVPGTIASFGVEQRFPFYGFNTLKTITANVTKVKGTHNLKAGIFFEHTTRPAARSSSFNGNISFNSDGSNPLNTNVGFANALLGVISSYTESTIHPHAHGQFVNTEWYVQDAWRVKRNFTVDGGVRFYYIQPTQSAGDKVAHFEPDKWNPAAAPLLFAPVTVPGQGRRVRNPVTGEILPLVYLSRLVPGTGDPYNGMVVYDGTVMDTPPIQVAPRLGFAWDVTGDGKTAIRGGAGVFYDRFSDDTILSLVEQPPLMDTWQTNYTTVRELLASPLTASPRGVVATAKFRPPTVTNWSLGVQRDIGFALVADVAYVGNAGRRQQVGRQLNGREYGYAYRPENLDPTNVSGGIVQPLPNELLRPYRGWESINQRQYTGYSDYHSLQVSVARRRAVDGLSFGVAYTHEIKNRSLGTIDPFIADNDARNYRQNGRRPHTLVINYAYEVPNLSRKWDSPLVKAVFDNWQVSGITSILSGTYGAISYGFVNAPTGTLTGTGGISAGGSRVDIVCDPNLPRGERTFSRQFRTECIKAPSDQFRLGNATDDEYRGLGYMNWDLSVFKNIPMGGNRRLQLRVELYNAFDTDQWSGVDTGAQFDWATREQTDANFGSLTGATRDARRVQLAARFTF